MPSRSSSRRKSNKHLKNPNYNKHFTSHLNRHSSPNLQSHDKLDSNILREQNGRNGNCPVKEPNSGRFQFVVGEEEKKRGSSYTSGHNNEMEGSVGENQKVVGESESDDKQVVGLDEEKVKTIVESEVLAATQQVEEEGQESITVQQKEEETSNPLVEPERTRDASELIVDDIRELEAELKQKANQEQDSQETEPPTNETSLALENETSREAEAAIEAAAAAAAATEADGADKLDSSEEKKESSSIETNEALLISESSVPQTDVASRAIEEKPEDSGETPLVKPEESGETKLPAEEEKVEESTVVQESSKEKEVAARESLPPSDIAAAETTSATMQEKTENPAGTESQQTNENQAPREYASWNSCCGIFDFLSR